MTKTGIGKGAAAVLAAAGAGCFLRSEYEKRHFVVEQVEISSPKLWRERTLVFITDVHDKEFGPGNKELLQAIRRIRPDGIVIGGDLMVSKGEGKLDASLRLLEGLADIGPVFYGPGNHELRLRKEREIYGDLFQILEKWTRKLGIPMLWDQRVPFGEMDITGVDLPTSYYRKLFLERPKAMPPGYLEKKLGKPDQSRFQLLLLHSPMYFSQCREWGADVTLSGHFHGGTIRLPLLGGVMTPQYQFFVPWCAGSFEQDGKWMVVGRGLGTHSINIRLNDMPQLLVLRLKPDKGGPEAGDSLAGTAPETGDRSS